MGTWDVGPFDNDHMSDFLGEFSRKRTAASGLRLIADLFADRSSWSEVVAGAELINIIRDHGKHDDSESFDAFHDWLARTNPTIPAPLLGMAREKLALVVRDPAILRQWSPANGKKWRKVSEAILRRLKLNR